VEGKYI